MVPLTWGLEIRESLLLKREQLESGQVLTTVWVIKAMMLAAAKLSVFILWYRLRQYSTMFNTKLVPSNSKRFKMSLSSRSYLPFRWASWSLSSFYNYYN